MLLNTSVNETVVNFILTICYNLAYSIIMDRIVIIVNVIELLTLKIRFTTFTDSIFKMRVQTPYLTPNVAQSNV